MKNVIAAMCCFVIGSHAIGAISCGDADAAAITSGEGDVTISVGTSGKTTIVIPSFDCSTTVSSVTEDGSPVTLQSFYGRLESMAGISVFAAPTTGTFSTSVEVQLGDSSNGEFAAVAVNSLDGSAPVTMCGVTVGKDISSEIIFAPGGDATLIIAFTASDSITVSTPTGFVKEHDEVIGSVRICVFLDADASQESAQFTFSSSVKSVVVALGLTQGE